MLKSNPVCINPTNTTGKNVFAVILAIFIELSGILNSHAYLKIELGKVLDVFLNSCK